MDGRVAVSTNDFDEARSILSRSAVPYRGELVSRSPFSTRISVAQVSGLSLSEVSTSGSLHVRAELPEDSYALVIGVDGSLEHHVAGSFFDVGDCFSLVHCPGQQIVARSTESYRLLFLRMGRLAMQDELQKLLGAPASTPLVLDPKLDNRTETGRRIRERALLLYAGVFQKDAPILPGLFLSLVQDLSTLLLEGQKHNYSRLLNRRSDAAPWQVRIAEEYLAANAHLAPSMGDVCQAVGVNARTLQHSFLSRRGYSPMDFLRSLRFAGVRRDLLAATRGDTVTAVALKWGFLHFGRFAGEYLARYGERPSDTLRGAMQR